MSDIAYCLAAVIGLCVFIFILFACWPFDLRHLALGSCAGYLTAEAYLVLMGDALYESLDDDPQSESEQEVIPDGDTYAHAESNVVQLNPAVSATSTQADDDIRRRIEFLKRQGYWVPLVGHDSPSQATLSDPDYRAQVDSRSSRGDAQE
ncbi:hypothetical protein [Pararobbsia alpina]|uniref:hypothetical protein n=1 Tax=Pararobbsia alpina TaxID=621374 RepID=UPI0039A59773